MLQSSFSWKLSIPQRGAQPFEGRRHKIPTFKSLTFCCTYYLEYILQYKNCEAIFALYNGKAPDSLQLLLDHRGPVIEPIYINLSTIADLASSSSTDLLRDYLSKHSDVQNDFINAK